MSKKSNLMNKAKNDKKYSYFPIFNFTGMVSIAEAAVLSCLIDQSGLYNDPEWLFLSQKEPKNPNVLWLPRYFPEWNKNTISTSLKKLKERNLIDKKRTTGGVLVKINWTKIDELADDYDLYCKRYEISQDTDVSYNNNNIQKYTKNIQQIDSIDEILSYMNFRSQKNYIRTPDTARLIANRMAEGRTVDDHKKLIDNMVENWRGTKMEVYLRPQTLFKDANSFDKYFNMEPVHKKGDDLFLEMY